MEFLYFILTCIGVTFLIVDSYIMRKYVEPIKQYNNFFNKLLSCYACTGFWVGLLISILILNPTISLGLITSLLINSISSMVISFLYKSLIVFLNPNA